MRPSAIVIGGGIVGLSIAMRLTRQNHNVVLLEKEEGLAGHQTGRNSGAVHAGPYYRPDSLKAKLCTLGNRQMTQFAQMHGIPHRITGKLLLATRPDELSRLQAIAERATLNCVPSEIIGPEEIREIEPAASGLSALHVKTAGITDYRKVAEKLSELSIENGAEILNGAEVTRIRQVGEEIAVEHTRGSHTAELLINAAGLYSD
jgi:(S)-2-hydroxyglutarate dehydrogenase